jgi:alkylated DNA repair dioxygenase AlkB
MTAKHDRAQPSLFSASEALELPNADIVIQRSLFDPQEADDHFDALISEIDWRQEQIRMFDKTTNIPRLTAWYGDDEKPYTYSGIEMQPSPWTERLLVIKTRVESLSETTFNSVLLNQYRDGSDSVAWHADNEPELGPVPVIGSVSFGATRDFQFRSNDPSGEGVTTTIELRHGDVLVMGGDTQKFWNHQIPKRANASTRINLTFRTVYL